MKKILFYINSIHHGGAQRVMINLAKYLANSGYECVLVTSFVDEWEYEIDPIVKRISLFNNQKELGNFINRNINLTKKLIEIIEKEKPNILISFMGENNFRAIIASKLTKTKCLVSVRNDPKREYPNLIMKSLANILYRKADAIVFQTEDAKKQFPISVQKKSEIILNPVDDVFFNTTYEGKRRDIVTVGRLTKQKNHELLIRAYSKIANKIEDNLIIYGEGELREYLTNLIKELKLDTRIYLPGQIRDVANTIKSAKLFVLSSDYEGMPNSLMEAMTLGIPCISTDCPCGGPRFLIVNDENGVLVKLNNELELSNTITKLINNKEQLGLLSLNAMNTSNIKFRSEKIYNDWELTIKRLLKNSKIQ